MPAVRMKPKKKKKKSDNFYGKYVIAANFW